MTSKLFSVRLSEQTSERLAERARSTGETKSALVQRYIEEGMRMDDHPGIFFQNGQTGRRAKLMGGPDVWEVINVWRDMEGDQEQRIKETAEGMGLHRDFVREALDYYVDFQEEIDERIRRNDEAGERFYAEWLKRQAVLAR
jgi:predicted transcriptional regulator